MKTTLPTVSVIIPAYNSAQTLPATLASVAAQTYPPLEILICDDSSTDATWAYLQSLKGKLKGKKGNIPVTIFQQPNAGAGAARNRCLKVAKGDLVTFLDADDRWLPAKLKRSVEVLVKGDANGKPYTFVAHDFDAVDVHGRHTRWNCAANARKVDCFSQGDMRTHYYYRGFVGILTVLMQRKAVMAAGGFHGKDRYGLDWECWHAVFKAVPDATFTVFDEPLALYTLSPTGLTSKALARLKEREKHIAFYARDVATRAGVWWPVLFTRAWLTLQYEAANVYVKTHQPGNLLRVVARAPFSWLRCVWRITSNSFEARGRFV
ncbi:MAG: glycosyltransferase [Alphaproteobacteria bacterium]